MLQQHNGHRLLHEWGRFSSN